LQDDTRSLQYQVKCAHLREFDVLFMVKLFLHAKRKAGTRKLRFMNYNSGYAYAKDFCDFG
jgi:hypothetical protein